MTLSLAMISRIWPETHKEKLDILDHITVQISISECTTQQRRFDLAMQR